MRSLALVALTLVAGCQLYFDDGDDEPCPPYAADIAPADQLRDPETGECQSFGGGGCDGRCGPCPDYGAVAMPDWGSCYSQCESLDESTCFVTSGCRAAYTIPLADDVPAAFRGCWATAPSGPVQGGGCTGLDAHGCSRHDDCVAYYEDATTRESQPLPATRFIECGPEPLGAVCASDGECDPGQRCTAGEEECNPAPGCTEGQACPAVCYGHCVADNTCANVDCELGTHCEQQCYPCDGTNGPCPPQCQPACVPDQNLCAAADCAPGTECVVTCTATGTCTVQCVPLTACAALTTEAACTSRGDCTPVYLGDDCTCYPGYCECNVLTYDRCETK